MKWSGGEYDLPGSNEKCAGVMGFVAGFFFGIAATGLTFWLVGCLK